MINPAEDCPVSWLPIAIAVPVVGFALIVIGIAVFVHCKLKKKRQQKIKDSSP